MKFLIVDDDGYSREFMRAALAKDGSEVVSAKNGEQALRILTESQFDFVVSDVNMPMVDGFDLAKALKENEKTKMIPILLYSSDHFSKTGTDLAKEFGFGLIQNHGLIEIKDEVMLRIKETLK